MCGIAMHQRRCQSHFCSDSGDSPTGPSGRAPGCVSIPPPLGISPLGSWLWYLPGSPGCPQGTIFLPPSPWMPGSCVPPCHLGPCQPMRCPQGLSNPPPRCQPIPVPLPAAVGQQILSPMQGTDDFFLHGHTSVGSGSRGATPQPVSEVKEAGPGAGAGLVPDGEMRM